MTGVLFHEITKAIQMDDEWWNDRIQEIPDASKLRAHPLTDLDILDANTFQPMMDTIQMIPVCLQETKTKHRLPTTRVPNGCTEALRVVHLQNVNDEQQSFHMTS
ncbi:hypothetical protein F2Q70_00038743 [Brassica cretica]|uniref:Uncharacterized protein n=1 Tax=Brassica cretica TaxID=69181 RepID=A0A8S9MSU6_BRACR|nr:hypothetical protein F2Q70_00038743 [Brassica cretica]KAF2620991.1 hypothetical protein F2Q68_00039409 [Brassica cretica]